MNMIGFRSAAVGNSNVVGELRCYARGCQERGIHLNCTAVVGTEAAFAEASLFHWARDRVRTFRQPDLPAVGFRCHRGHFSRSLGPTHLLGLSPGFQPDYLSVWQLISQSGDLKGDPSGTSNQKFSLQPEILPSPDSSAAVSGVSAEIGNLLHR